MIYKSYSCGCIYIYMYDLYSQLMQPILSYAFRRTNLKIKSFVSGVGHPERRKSELHLFSWNQLPSRTRCINVQFVQLCTLQLRIMLLVDNNKVIDFGKEKKIICFVGKRKICFWITWKFCNRTTVNRTIGRCVVIKLLWDRKRCTDLSVGY